MTMVRITVPEDFDERYSKYREKFEDRKMPEPFFSERLENERKHLSSLTNEEDFQHEINKWRPLKVILDTIYKDLSPFLPGNAQIIKIDLSKLDLPEKQASYILMMLVYERICRWRIDKSSAVTSTEALSEYMAGNGIVVSDYEKFQEFRNKVNDFYKFMEDQRDQKFPKIKPPELPDDFKDVRQGQTKALERALEKGLEKEALKEEIMGEINSQQVTAESETPLVVYNPTTGKGKVNGTKKFRFKDGSPEHQIFNQLYSKLPKKVPRQDVLIAGGFYKDYEEADPVRKTDETSFINDRVVKIREKTGLNTEQLVNNAGNLTLEVRKPGKLPPKEVRHTAVWG